MMNVVRNNRQSGKTFKEGVVRMSVFSIKEGEKVLHTKTKAVYTIIGNSNMKVGDVWYDAVTYKNGDHVYARRLEDFNDKFEPIK